MPRRGGLFRRFFRAITRPFRVRVEQAPPSPPGPPPGIDYIEPEPSRGWHLVGYYSPPHVDKGNWQNMEAGDPEPTDREFHRSPVLRFRLGNTDMYRSFLGPTDATIDQIIAYLTDQYGLEPA